MYKFLSVSVAFGLLLTGPLTSLGRAENANKDELVVPLHDPSKPAVIQAKMMSGGITVRGTDRKDIAVISKHAIHDEEHEDRDDDHDARNQGLKRLDIGTNGLDIREDNNTVTIKTTAFQGGDLVLEVPRHTSVKLKCLSGEMNLDNIEGELEVEDLNGGIHLKDVGGSVVAHSLNGAVVADLKTVDPSKPMSFSTMNGKIDVTLPDNLKAKFTIKTDNGEVLSDFDVKLDPGVPDVEKSDGGFRVRIDKTIHGTVNGGGPEYQFRSFNGEIIIRKQK